MANGWMDGEGKFEYDQILRKVFTTSNAGTWKMTDIKPKNFKMDLVLKMFVILQFLPFFKDQTFSCFWH